MIKLEHIRKTFDTTSGNVHAVQDVSLEIHDGEIFGIIGFSGAGKSTLVRCINLLERPDSGSVQIDGVELTTLGEKQLREVRTKIGMIFQHFNLMRSRTVYENIDFPLKKSGLSKSQRKEKIQSLLELVGLTDKQNVYPSRLSGGQKQRVAIARALANDPKVLLCDEATSALDPKTTHDILELLKDINERLGITIIIITHQMSVVEEICNRVAILDGGVVAEEGEVSAVFADPQSDAAKRLVFPDGEEEVVPVHPGERVLRVVFNGAMAAGAPLITQMAMDEKIAANILYASTKCLGDKVYGNMLLGLPAEEETVQRAVKYLTRTGNVLVTEVTEHA